jgi:hypothetical protein
MPLSHAFSYCVQAVALVVVAVVLLLIISTYCSLPCAFRVYWRSNCCIQRSAAWFIESELSSGKRHSTRLSSIVWIKATHPRKF